MEKEEIYSFLAETEWRTRSNESCSYSKEWHENGCDSLFKKFLSLFIAQAPWRFVYVVLIISTISMGWFAYENAGDAIGLKASATSDVAYTQDNAVQAASNWLYTQTYFGDRVTALNLTCISSGPESYEALARFTALDYRIDSTGALHHLSMNHTVSMKIIKGNVVSVVEGSRDIISDPQTGPMTSLEERVF